MLESTICHWHLFWKRRGIHHAIQGRAAHRHSETTEVTLQADPILIVGAGAMAIEYAKVLKSLQTPMIVLGRGQASSESFHRATNVPASFGTLHEQLVALAVLPRQAIVAVSAEHLAAVTVQLIEAGVRRLLVEKPAALDLTEVAMLEHVAGQHGAEIRIAYNRRFMASVRKAQEMVAADGGALSVKFDFTEASRRIEALNKPVRELETWFYGNSTHVLDLAFHFFGQPSTLQATTSGRMPWHPTAAFAGYARNAAGALLSWHANWAAPGRWGVEILTAQHRLILQPLEKLRVQSQGSFAEVEIEIDDGDDQKFKPGLLKQMRAFLYGENAELLPLLDAHAQRMAYYEIIRTGGSYSA